MQAPLVRDDMWTLRRASPEIEEVLRLATRVQELRDALREAEADVARWIGGAGSARARANVGAHAADRKWSEEMVLAEIIARHENGEPLNASAVESSLVDAARRRFGSWQAALEVVGLEYDRLCLRRRPWTRAEVIAELRAQAARDDYAISDSFVNTCRRLFGGVLEARRAAGVPLRYRRWSRERVVRELRAMGASAADANLRAACVRYFGSIAEARRAAGVTIRAEWTRERVIDELRAAWEAGVPVDGRLADAAYRIFGSREAANEAAGIPIQRRRSWSKDKLLHELRGRWRSRQIDDRYAEYLCVKFFGSIEAARRAAGNLPLVRSWSKRAVIAELRKNWRNRGIVDQSVSRACDRYFGGVTAARRAAGLPLYQAGDQRRFAAKPTRVKNRAGRRRRAAR